MNTKTKPSMRAKFLTGKTEDSFRNAMQPHNKETVSDISVVAVIKGQPTEVITARMYMGRSRNASQVECCLWLNSGKGGYRSGKGVAGGYGYHKQSAALAGAISSAGIELYGSNYGRRDWIDPNAAPIDFKKRAYIGGCGESSMREALAAIAYAAGYRGKLLITGC